MVLDNTTNPIHEFVDILSLMASTGTQAWYTKVATLAEENGLTKPRFKLWLVSKAGDVVDIVSHIDILQEDRVSEWIKITTNLHESLIPAVEKNSGNDFQSAIGGANTLTLLRSLADMIHIMDIDRNDAIDRSHLLELTNNLIPVVQSLDIQEYAKRALVMKLSSFQRILIECKYYTDDDLRRRVKSVLADYWSEAKQHEWENNTVSEKMVAWAKAASRPGIFALALTADVSSVMALLPPPS